ncbi:MAG: hypothetical protein AVO33_09190 [delta proteobacterium ML8_F1]|nr:MAG: hypothetical protein AVO33_09190 [delta proteobacterium ML8_F1]
MGDIRNSDPRHYRLRFPLENMTMQESVDGLFQYTGIWLEIMGRSRITETEVHDIRVVIRQLMSLQYFLKPLIDKKHYEEGKKTLDRGLKELEGSREKSVFIKALKEFETFLTLKEGNVDNSRQLHALRCLVASLEEEIERDWATFERDQGGIWPDCIKNWLAWIKEEPLADSDENYTAQRLEKMIGKWLGRYHRRQSLKGDGLHQSRIAMKKIRYLYRAVPEAMVPKNPTVIRTMAAYQETTGQLHDISRFREMSLGIPDSLARAWVDYEAHQEKKYLKQCFKVHQALVEALTEVPKKEGRHDSRNRT